MIAPAETSGPGPVLLWAANVALLTTLAAAVAEAGLRLLRITDPRRRQAVRRAALTVCLIAPFAAALPAWGPTLALPVAAVSQSGPPAPDGPQLITPPTASVSTGASLPVETPRLPPAHQLDGRPEGHGPPHGPGPEHRMLFFRSEGPGARLEVPLPPGLPGGVDRLIKRARMVRSSQPSNRGSSVTDRWSATTRPTGESGESKSISVIAAVAPGAGLSAAAG